MESTIRCVSKEELQGKSNYIIIDVRTNEERDNGYIQNSIHIPIDELETKLPELPKSKLYITTCGKGGGRSIKAAEMLQKYHLNSQWLCGGTMGW
ncbi:MAG: rhodanese-related sulfurtransferase [Crocinitomicaceae bacterium]|jgi:rhodanese-related sulfurtransferase